MPINVKNGVQASVLALLLSFCFGMSAAPLQMCQSFPNLWCLDVMEYSLLYSALFSASKVVENFSLITLIGFFAGIISLPICKQLQGKFGINLMVLVIFLKFIVRGVLRKTASFLEASFALKLAPASVHAIIERAAKAGEKHKRYARNEPVRRHGGHGQFQVRGHPGEIEAADNIRADARGQYQAPETADIIDDKQAPEGDGRALDR